MPRTRAPYPAAFRDQIVELHRSGRSAEDLAREFEPCVATIHTWIRQADRDGGRRADILSSEERDELRRLRRENKQLRQERDILSKGRSLKAPLVQAQWTTPGLRRTTRPVQGLRVHDVEPGRVSDRYYGTKHGRVAQRLSQPGSAENLPPETSLIAN